MTFGATVRAVTRSRLIPSRAALTLTPAAVKKVSDITNRQKCQVGYSWETECLPSVGPATSYMVSCPLYSCSPGQCPDISGHDTPTLIEFLNLELLE